MNKKKKISKQQNWKNAHSASYQSGGAHVPAILRGKGGHRNNLQLLYKRTSQINQKNRKRKYKARVFASDFIQRTCRGLSRPRRPHLVGFRVKRGFRVGFNTFIGIEKTVMTSRGKVRIKYRKYPDYFFTKKSSKSRMGKGKGKIMGRILKIRPGEVFLDVKAVNPLKWQRRIRAIRQAIPSVCSMVFKNRWAGRLISNYYKNRTWFHYKPAKRKKKFWELKIVVARPWLDKVYTSPSYSNKEFNFRNYFFKWKRQKRHQYKKGYFYHRGVLRRHSFVFKSATVAKDFNLKPRKRLYGNFGFFLSRGLKKTAFCGGRERNLKLRFYATKNYSRRMVALQFAPDAEGFYGIYKMGNRIIKQKLRRERFFAHRRPVNREPGFY